jgi:hypothetical protein
MQFDDQAPPAHCRPWATKASEISEWGGIAPVTDVVC